jgi:hypothetical protein
LLPATASFSSGFASRSVTSTSTKQVVISASIGSWPVSILDAGLHLFSSGHFCHNLVVRDHFLLHGIYPNQQVFHHLFLLTIQLSTAVFSPRIQSNPTSDTSRHVVCVNIDGVWTGEWIYWPLYTHDSELQTTTAPLLISTIHKSPQHQLNFSSLQCLH